jgi:hypothetical protein
MEKTNCKTCQHYFVTWEPQKPHGCKIFNFKSQLIPSIVVIKNSGSTCTQYLKVQRQYINDKQNQ